MKGFRDIKTSTGNNGLRLPSRLSINIGSMDRRGGIISPSSQSDFQPKIQKSSHQFPEFKVPDLSLVEEKEKE